MRIADLQDDSLDASLHVGERENRNIISQVSTEILEFRSRSNFWQEQGMPRTHLLLLISSARIVNRYLLS